MNFASEIRFADEKTKRAFKRLEGSKSEQELFNSISHALGEIQKNAFVGTQIQKKLFPNIYTRKYSIDNL